MGVGMPIEIIFRKVEQSFFERGGEEICFCRLENGMKKRRDRPAF